jgi:hypothetical protein
MLLVSNIGPQPTTLVPDSSPFLNTRIHFHVCRSHSQSLTMPYNAEAILEGAAELASLRTYHGLAAALILSIRFPDHPRVGGTSLFDHTWASISTRPGNRIFTSSGQLRRRAADILFSITRLANAPNWERYIRHKSRRGFQVTDMSHGFYVLPQTLFYADDILVINRM